VQTLVSMTGLSKRSVFRCLTLLVKASIIAKKRLKSTSLYTIHSNYVVSTRHQEVPHRHHLVPDRHVLKELITRTNSNITTKVDEIINRSLPKDIMINNLALLPLEELKQSMKRHPYYIPKAIERKEELDRQKNLVPVEKILNVLKNVSKNLILGMLKRLIIINAMELNLGKIKQWQVDQVEKYSVSLYEGMDNLVKLKVFLVLMVNIYVDFMVIIIY
jgi:hypothetical protein